MQEWILINDSHPRFNTWLNVRGGYKESFWKRENPNSTLVKTATDYGYGVKTREWKGVDVQ